MKLLDRYIGQTIIQHTALVLLVLVAIYFFTTLVEELNYVGRREYGMMDALQYALMLMPRQTYELFPMAALLGGMLGLGTMASSNELTVIRAAGVSVQRIMLAVLKTALVLMLLMALVGEFAAPALEQQARIQRAQALTENISLNVKEGLWAREGNTFVNIERLLPGGLANGVSLYVFDERHSLREMVRADMAVYREGSWVLQAGQRSRLTAAGVETAAVGEQRWDTGLTPEVISVAALPAEKLSVTELAGYVAYTRANGLDARLYEVALWMRAVAPLAAVGMMLLAVPFVFGSLRSVGIGVRITVGALLGIGFYLFNGVFARAGIVYHLPPALSATLPTLLVFGLWWLLMRRVR